MERIKRGLTHFDNALERYFSKKWHWLITIPVIVLTIALLYLAFCFTNTRYLSGYGYRDNIARTIARVLGGVIISVSLAYIIFEQFFGRLTGRRVVWAFLVISSTLLTLWGFQHHLNGGHHHDAGALGSGNHWSIIYDIFSTGEIPAVNMHNQYYQPKLYHTIIAYLMKFNMLFIHVGSEPVGSSGQQKAQYPAYTLDAYHALEFTRVFMIALGIASLYAIYRIYKGLGLKDKKVALCTAITVMIPEFWFIQFFLNNDGLALTMSLMALAFALEFKKGQKILPLLASAVCLGLGMMSKLNAALMAIPMAFIFLYTIYEKIKESPQKGHDLLVLAGKFALFAIIVFPLGLWTPILYKVKYGMPIGYVLDLTPTQESKEAYGMYIDPSFYNFFERCLLFPSEDLFYSPFNYRWRHKVDGVYVNQYGVIDFNCWTAFFKTSFFDEWDDFFKHQGYFAAALMVAAMYLMVFLVLLAILCGVYYVIRFFIRKQYKGSWFVPALLLLTLIVYATNYIIFVNKYPVGCSQNARYLMPIWIPIQAVVGSMIVDAQEHFLAAKKKYRAQ